MSAFVASDNDLFVLRRFERLGARVALRMQDRIAKLEEDLSKEDQLGMDEKSHCGTFRNDQRERRLQLMDEVESRLANYRTQTVTSKHWDVDLTYIQRDSF